MYPLTHLFITSKVLGRLTPALALGSVLPDILVGTGITWKRAHQPLQQNIFNTLGSTEMALGAVIHGIDLPGLDYFSDITYENGQGYAFQKATGLESKVLELGITKKDALWRGHNFVEMGVELYLNQKHADLWGYLEKAAEERSLKAQIYRLACILDAQQPDLINAILDRFLTIRGQEAFLAGDYSKKLSKFYSLSISQAQCLEIINLSQILIEGNFKQFLNDCSHKINDSLARSSIINKI